MNGGTAWAALMIMASGLAASIPVASAGVQPAGLELKLSDEDAAHLGPEDAALVQRFIDESAEALPPSVRQALPLTIPVTFPTLNPGETQALAPDCGEGSAQAVAPVSQVRGDVLRPSLFHRGYRIQIDALLLPVILDAEKSGKDSSPRFSCYHHSLFEDARATILHEVAHVYDDENIRPKEQRLLLRNCRELRMDDPEMVGDECRDVDQYEYTISSSKRFLSLTDWKNGISGEHEKNLDPSTSPDSYEWTNPRETFAVEFEYFLMDPEYSCRRPALHDFFKASFGGFDPFPEQGCRQREDLSAVSATAEGGMVTNTFSLDPSRIYRIDYLFAGKGSALMSHWGHSMFRVVACAPGHAVGPQCLQDLEYHFVMGFVAYEDDPTINPWKGLVGGYPSRITVMPYVDAINDYTRNQFREVESIPLNLSREQIGAFSQQLLEAYWAYQGNYAFLTNNCAEEATALILRALPGVSLSGIITPIGLKNALYDSGLATKGNEELIPSDLSHIESRFKVLSPYWKDGKGSVQDFIKFSTADERHQIAEAIAQDSSAGKPEKYSRLAALFYIEDQYISQALLRRINQVSAELIWDYFNYLNSRAAEDHVQGAAQFLNSERTTILHGSATGGDDGSGYGIPLVPTDVPAPTSTDGADQAVLARNQVLIDTIKEATKNLVDEFKKTRKNRLYILEQLAGSAS